MGSQVILMAEYDKNFKKSFIEGLFIDQMLALTKAKNIQKVRLEAIWS